MSDMFSTRKTPWEDLGNSVIEAKNSEEAIRKSGLDWTVVKRGLKDEETGVVFSDVVATVREDTNKKLGIVDPIRYQIVQNIDAFRFTDKLLGEGVSYVSAGSLFDDKKIWLLAKLPSYYIFEEEFMPYLVFINSHDGKSGVRVAVTPIRVLCSNTLNLALDHADRSWACNHRGDLKENLHEASKTLGFTDRYMKSLEKSIELLKGIPVDEVKAQRLISYLLPINKDDMKRKIEHIKEMRNDIFVRWRDAPDLSETAKDGYRFLNAVSDFGIHTEHHRDTKNFRENLFGKVISGNGLYIDKAYEIVKASA